MLPQELITYMEKPCRLKLKSGKEVFGVVWKEDTDFNSSYFFASSEEYRAYIVAKKNNDINTCNKIKTPINIDDVVGAETLKGIIPGKDMFL